VFKNNELERSLKAHSLNNKKAYSKIIKKGCSTHPEKINRVKKFKIVS